MYTLWQSNSAGWKIPEMNGGFQLGKSLIHDPFSIAVFDYRMVDENSY